ncbi:hypothetical protein LUZ60_007886 [Juncus effusus]|nr:hypothetical protein LUZ60_007886 [Juncus effusus]
MAKIQLLVLVAFAFIGVALAGLPDFVVEGRVYCDTCRAGFETNVTNYIQGAKVKLECRHFENGKVEHVVEGVTDATGTYKLLMKDNHEEEICEVELVESPLTNCNEIIPGRNRARVTLADDTGITSNQRYANPLGYLKDSPLDICAKVMEMYKLDDDED